MPVKQNGEVPSRERAWSQGPLAEIDKGTTLLSLFEARVLQQPGAKAVQDGNRSLSYQELNYRSEELKRRVLVEAKGEFVACLLPQSLEYIVAQIGVMKSGKIFAPLDVDNPTARLALMLKDLGTPRLITTREIADQSAPEYSGLLFVDETKDEIIEESKFNELQEVAFCLFTSGSTGTPKGTYIEQASLVNFVQWFISEYGVTSSDRSAFYSNPSFDMAITQSWPFLVTGGTVVVVPLDIRRNIPEFQIWIQNEDISFLKLPAVVAQYFLDKVQLTRLRFLIFAGERLSFLQDYKLNPALPFKVGQSYGLTEGTLGQTYKTYAPSSSLTLSVGKPIPNLLVLVLNPDLSYSPQGTLGEIYIGGIGVSKRGYHNRPIETHEAYIDFPDQPGTLIFRTKDLGFWREDGELEVVGRADQQIKVAGCRVEIGEIEVALSKHPLVSRCVVVFEKGPPQKLKAFVVSEMEGGGGGGLTIGTVSAFLRGSLPPYAVPSSLQILETFPLTLNGKVDRKALLEMEPQDNSSSRPLTGMQMDIAKLWSKTLDFPLESIRREHTYYQLGGNSLKASEFLFELRKSPWNLDITFTQFFEHPTLKDFTGMIETTRGLGRIGKELSQEALNEKVESALQKIVFEDAGKLTLESGCDDSILLTGATGYLGNHLLCQLLKMSDKKIYCLVRAGNDSKAIARILAKFDENKIKPCNDLSRLHSLAGDLSQPNLGLSQCRYKELLTQVSTVVHCGADVHHFKPFGDLEGPNVDGTRNIIQFVVGNGKKILHHISTAAACETYDGVWYEEPLVGLGPLCRSGYSQTKWVAEKLVTESMKQGLQASVYRVGDLGAHSEHSSFNQNDLFSNVIKTFMLSKTFVDKVEWPLFAQADTGAHAITEVILSSAAPGKIYHIGTRIKEAMSAELKKAGLKPYELQDWIQMLRDRINLDSEEYVFITREWFLNRFHDFQGDAKKFVDYLNFDWSTKNLDGALKRSTLTTLALKQEDIRRYVGIIHNN